MADDSLQLKPWPTTTDWRLIGGAGASSSSARRVALDKLLARYLPPLRAHLVLRLRLTPHQAEDILQEFITQKILYRDLLAVASPEKGRFRTLLLTALDRFVIDYHRSAQARHDRCAQPLLGTESTPGCVEPASPSDPNVFDVAWARTILLTALKRMKLVCKRSGRRDVWIVFYHRVVAPVLTRTPEADYATLVAKYQLVSVERASNLLITAKRQFDKILREIVRESVSSDEEMEEELIHLRQSLTSPGVLEVAVQSFQREAGGGATMSAIDHADPQRLSELLDVREPTRTWTASESSACFLRQLDTPLAEMMATLASPRREEMQRALLAWRAHFTTLSDLLRHPRPSRELLAAAIEWANLKSRGRGDRQPRQVIEAVRTCAQAAGVLQRDPELMKIPAAQLRNRFQDLRRRVWIPPAERELLKHAIQTLQNDGPTSMPSAPPD